MLRCIIPESPEVKLSCDLITPLVINKKIDKAYSTPNSRYRNTLQASFLKDAKVASIKTRGKFMYWQFDNNYIMFNTFGMSGQWSPSPDKNPCFIVEFEDNSKICFNDARHFGTISFTNNPQDLTDKLSTFGWDTLNVGLEPAWLDWIVSQCAKTKKPIGELMMDQTKFCGTGNYIRGEALYRAQLSPWSPSNTISKEKILELCYALHAVMTESYQQQGATIRTYKDPFGAEGKYASFFKVYSKDYDPFGNVVIKEEMPKGRLIHWCPAVQK